MIFVVVLIILIYEIRTMKKLMPLTAKYTKEQIKFIKSHPKKSGVMRKILQAFIDSKGGDNA